MSKLFSLIAEQIRDKLPLTEDKKQLLHQQTISQYTPGTILLLFDLLQEWEFDLYVEKIEPANAKMKKPKILESHGEPPAQYGEEEEGWE